LDSFKFFLYEKIYLPQIPITAFLHVSFDEKKYYEEILPKSFHEFLPAGIQVNNLLKYCTKDKITILFVGSLFMPNNIEGLNWYLKKIHNILVKKYENYQLIVAGNTRGNLDPHLKSILNEDPQITFHDSPSSLDDIYSQASIFINPMLNGAGVKLKSLNAICFGLPVVSTKIGNEGTGLVSGRDIIVAENSKEFLEGITFLIENHEFSSNLVNSSQEYILTTYNQTVAIEKIFAKYEV
jgi:glycosyltransferase involved in cell wall biosynthesis